MSQCVEHLMPAQAPGPLVCCGGLWVVAALNCALLASPGPGYVPPMIPFFLSDSRLGPQVTRTCPST